MAIQTLTVQVNNSQRLNTQVALDGQNFGLNFYVTKVPNLQDGTVAQFWYLDLYDSQGNAVVLGIGLVAGIDMLFPYRALSVPKGKLFVYPSQDGLFIDPTVDTFSEDNAHLYYQPVADVVALGTSS